MSGNPAPGGSRSSMRVYLAGFHGFCLHGQVDFDVAAGGVDAHVAEPTADDVYLNPRLEKVHGSSVP